MPHHMIPMSFFDHWPVPPLPDDIPLDTRKQIWEDYLTVVEPLQILGGLLATNDPNLQHSFVKRLREFDSQSVSILCLHVLTELLPARLEMPTREYAQQCLAEIWREMFDVRQRHEYRQMKERAEGTAAERLPAPASAKEIAREMIAEMNRTRAAPQNFSGRLCAELTDESGNRLTVANAYHRFRAPSGGAIILKTWVERGDGSHSPSEEMIYSSGENPANDETLHFELTADCPYSQVRPVSLTLPLSADAVRSKAAVFTLYDKLPPGTHKVWVTAYQAGMLMQSVEMELVVTRAGKPVARKSSARKSKPTRKH